LIRFSRRARWLPELFTPSVVPTTAYPDKVAQDVSLVQPYDGGGIVLPDPGSLFTQVDSAAAALDNTVLGATSPNEVARIYSVAAHVTAGVAPSVLIQLANVEDPNKYSVVSLTRLAIAEAQGLECFCRMVPPNCTINGRHYGGDGATIVQWNSFIAFVPIGTVFYV